MALPVDRILIVCDPKEPSSIAYMNIYEPGDIWIRTQGCEVCSIENRQKCCTNCPVLIDSGCILHIENPRNSRKPFHCIVNPTPDICHSYCSLEFECIEGNNLGKKRRSSDLKDVLIEATPIT